MGQNTKNGATLQELASYPDKSEISGKRMGILLLEIEKKESKKLKTFQKLKYSNRLARVLSTIRAGRARAVSGKRPRTSTITK